MIRITPAVQGWLRFWVRKTPWRKWLPTPEVFSMNPWTRRHRAAVPEDHLKLDSAEATPCTFTLTFAVCTGFTIHILACVLELRWSSENRRPQRYTRPRGEAVWSGLGQTGALRGVFIQGDIWLPRAVFWSRLTPLWRATDLGFV